MAWGLGKQKNKAEMMEFDLEKDLKNPVELKKAKEKINAQVTSLKAALRQGEDKKVFEETQTVLQGYLSTQKVIQRIGRR